MPLYDYDGSRPTNTFSFFCSFFSSVTRWLLRNHWLELALHYAFLHPTAAACVCFARLPYVSGRFSLSYDDRGVSLSLARLAKPRKRWALRLRHQAFEPFKRHWIRVEDPCRPIPMPCGSQSQYDYLHLSPCRRSADRVGYTTCASAEHYSTSTANGPRLFPPNLAIC
jgi:hypothetical protein